MTGYKFVIVVILLMGCFVFGNIIAEYGQTNEKLDATTAENENLAAENSQLKTGLTAAVAKVDRLQSENQQLRQENEQMKQVFPIGIGGGGDPLAPACPDPQMNGTQPAPLISYALVFMAANLAWLIGLLALYLVRHLMLLSPQEKAQIRQQRGQG